MDRLIEKNREQILALAARHGAKNVRLFGSAARGEAGPESDIDLLVEFCDEASLLDHVALQQDMEDLLGRGVDIVSEKGVYWLLRRRILLEALPL